MTLPAETGPAHQRDHGLVRGIGPVALTATIVNGVVGAGIFTLPAAMAQQAGAAAPWAYVLCALAMGCVVICFAEAGSRAPTSGGAYGTVEAAFGPGAGFVTGFLLISSDLLASGAVASGLAATIGSFIPELNGASGHRAVILAIYAALTALNLSASRLTARLIGAATVVKLLPLILFIILGLIFYSHGAPPSTAPGTPGGFGSAVILALFAFCGMETPLGVSGEIRDAHRTLPRALFAAMGTVLLLYLAIQFTAQHFLGSNLANAPSPIADAAGHIAPGLRAIMLAAASVSMFAWMASGAFGTSRMIFAIARDGHLPAFLSSVRPRSGVPAAAVLTYIVIAAGLALTGSFIALIIASTLDSAAIYILAASAAWILQRQGVAMAGPPLRLRILPIAVVGAIGSMTAMILAAKGSEILGLLLTILAALVVYAFWGTLSPRPPAKGRRPLATI